MRKLLVLKHGSLFAGKDGIVKYLTNEQLSATGKELNAKTEQVEIKPDLTAQKLRQTPPIEAEISGLLALGLEEVEKEVSDIIDNTIKSVKKPSKAKGKKVPAEGEETK